MPTLEELESRAEDLHKEIKDIEIPKLKSSFSEMIEVGSSKDMQELNEKVIEFIPDEKEFFDNIIIQYERDKDVSYKQFTINADTIKAAVMAILTRRFQITDIYNLPLEPQTSLIYQKVKDMLIDNEYTDLYLVEPIIPYFLFKEDIPQNETSIDISQLDWYVPIMSELIRYIELSNSEANGRTASFILPKDNMSKKYQEKWNYLHRILIAIIEEQAEMHVFIDALYDRQLFLHNKKKAPNITPFLNTMYGDYARKAYHTYCQHKLTMQRISASEITVKHEQSLKPLLNGNWQTYIIKRMMKAFETFLIYYDRNKSAQTYWDTLVDRIDRWHIKENIEINSQFLNNIVMLSIPQFDVLQAFVDTLLMFPKELWRGINWDSQAQSSYSESAFHTFIGAKSEKAPFLNRVSVCEFANALLANLVDRAVLEKRLPSRNLYLPISKQFQIQSYMQLQRTKDYMFNITAEEVMNEILGVQNKSQNLLDVIAEIKVENKPIEIETKPIIYDENYDWENEFNWREE